MKTSYIGQFLFAVAIIMIAGQSLGFAQEKEGEENPRSIGEKIEAVKISLEYDQPVPLPKFLEYIQQQVDFPLNTVVQRGADTITIPPMKLKNVHVFSAFEAAIEATRGELDWEDGEETLSFRRAPDYQNDSELSMMVVLNVSQITQNKDLETLLSAIDMGLQIHNGEKKEDSKVIVKFHEQTQLLFVKGTSAELNFVHQIVEQLGGKTHGNRGGGVFK